MDLFKTFWNNNVPIQKDKKDIKTVRKNKNKNKKRIKYSQHSFWNIL